MKDKSIKQAVKTKNTNNFKKGFPDKIVKILYLIYDWNICEIQIIVEMSVKIKITIFKIIFSVTWEGNIIVFYSFILYS